MQHKLPIGITVLGALLAIIAAILGWVVMPKVIDDQIAKETQLRDGSETLEKWADVPYPIYLTFYIFHVTNPEEVEAGEKPKFKEMGPYAYRQYRLKVNLTHDEDHDPENTIQYKERRTYFFDKTRSGENSEDDVVNVINIAYVAVVHGVWTKLNVLTDLVANEFLESEKLIRRNVRVGDLLFNGFDVDLYTSNPALSMGLPEEFSGGRFGLYKGKNGTDSKRFNIYTGVGGPEEFGTIKTYDEKNQLEFWISGTPCDQVKGTDGSLYPPFLTTSTKLDVFSTDICRSLTFEFFEKSEYMDVPSYRFTVPKWTLEDPRINANNLCYCLSKSIKGCAKAGVISLEGCRNGAPIMMSTPYFLDGDKGYSEDAGLPEANPEKHRTYLDIEPRSGVLLKAHKRIQVNVDVKVIPGVNAYKNLTKEVIFPLMWADESTEMDEKNVEELQDKLLTPLKIVDVTKWVVFGLGVAVLLTGIVLYGVAWRKAKEAI